MQQPEQTDPLIGTQIGSYIIQRRLGEGGMGVVYELLHPGIGKRLALKLLHTEYAAKPEIVKRFFDEARAVNVIDHPNIVDIIDFNRLPDGRSYITMEFLEGDSLAHHIRNRGALPTEEVKAIALPICSALEAAHACGIIHRDLKPENIHLVPRQGRLFVKVLDFGIAKLSADLHSAASATRSGVVMGTPTYMSPEQAMGRTHEIDHRTDIYALGVILYQMLAGEVPFAAESFGDLMLMHLQEPPRPLQAFRSELAHPWNPIVQMALAKRREDRFQSMMEFGAAIQGGTSAPTAIAIAGPATETVAIASSTGSSLIPVLPCSAGPVSWSSVPGSVIPGSVAPRGVIPGSMVPGSVVPGSVVPGSVVPGSMVPGSAPGTRHYSDPTPRPVTGTEYLGLPSRIDTVSRKRRGGVGILFATGLVAAIAAIAFLFLRSGSRPERAEASSEPRAAVALAPPPDAAPAPSVADASAPVAVAPPDATITAVAAPTPPTTEVTTSQRKRHARHTRPTKPKASDQASSATGTLRVLVRPWGMVYIDGRKQGTTPQVLTLEAGKHEVRVVNQELGKDVVKSVHIEPNQTEFVTLSWQ